MVLMRHRPATIARMTRSKGEPGFPHDAAGAMVCGTSRARLKSYPRLAVCAGALKPTFGAAVVVAIFL